MFGRETLFLTAFVICLGRFRVDAALNPEERKAMLDDMRPSIIKCAKADLNLQEIAELRKKNPEVFVCQYECFLKSIGVFDDDNMLKPEKMTEIAKRYIKNDDTFAKFESILKDCSSVNEKEIKEGDGDCMRAKLLLQCFASHKEDGLLGQQD